MARRVLSVPYLGFVLLAIFTASASAIINDARRSAEAESSPSSTAPKVLFATHHKTGTLLAKQVSACLLRHNVSIEVEVSNHYEGEAETKKFAKVVHMVRNPVSVIVSSYLYHRDKGEKWGNWHGSAKSIVNNSFMGKGDFQVGDRETYKELLNRVSTERGLLTELRRFLRPPSYPGQVSLFGHEALQMNAAHKSCSEKKTCVEICLEDFMRSSASFNASWRKALGHMGVDIEAPALAALRGCVSHADVNGKEFRGHEEHRTSSALTPAARAKLERVVRELDAGWHGYAVKDIEDEVGCH